MNNGQLVMSKGKRYRFFLLFSFFIFHFSFALGTAYAQEKTGKIVGLALIVEFQDHKAIHTWEQVNDFFNRVGGIKGSALPASVYDYFYTFSNGRLEHTNIVAPIITLPYRSTDKRAQDPATFITDALEILKKTNFDISKVSVDKQNRAAVLNVLQTSPSMAGGRGGALRFNVSINGVGFYRVQWSGMSTKADLATSRLGLVVHEIGHALMEWHHVGLSGRSRCRMYGGWILNPYYRHIAGWINPIDITNTPPGTKLTIEANSHQAFVYRRNAQEAFYIEARRPGGFQNLPPNGIQEGGLLIWHIHTGGEPGYAIDTPLYRRVGFSHVELVHADGRNDILGGIANTDELDLFRLGVKTRFDSTSVPSSRWHDGTESGLNISRISDIGDVMTFTLTYENYNDEMLPKYKLLDRIRSSVLATENVVVELEQDIKVEALIKLPSPRKPGITVTLRSANPHAPITLSRGVSGHLFTVPKGTTLILENIIIDGGGSASFKDNDDVYGIVDFDGDDESVGGANANNFSNNAYGGVMDGAPLVTVTNGGTLIMKNGAVLRNNVNPGEAGGVLVDSNGTFIMQGGTISGNTATVNSGAVYVRRSTFTMSGGEIIGNSSATYAGGVRVHVGTFTMTSGKINGNNAKTEGGGVMVSGGATFTMGGGEINGNTSPKNGSGVRITGSGSTFNLNGGTVSGSGKNVTAIVSGTYKLNTAPPKNAEIKVRN